jgi:hypothetical protein
VTSDPAEELFSAYGSVKRATVIEGKGFGFVEMSSPAEAEGQTALDATSQGASESG